MAKNLCKRFVGCTTVFGAASVAARFKDLRKTNERGEIMNNWTHRIDRIVNEFDSTPSQKKFCRSVATQIDSNAAVFPTDAQKRIVWNIYRHYIRRLESDAERDALEAMGLLTAAVP